MIQKTNDTEGVIALRVELNREQSYVRCTKVRINNGAEVKQSTKWISGIKWQNVVSLRKALKKIRTIRPVYEWIKKKGFEAQFGDIGEDTEKEQEA